MTATPTQAAQSSAVAPDVAPGPRGQDLNPLVRLSDVSKVYANGTVALAGVTFAVRAGEFVSLVGPSGCGKSTILRIVAGLGAPSGGGVQVEGLPPAQARRRHQNMAYVFQDATLLPWSTVRGNVELPLKLRGVGRAERQAIAREALDTVGLDHQVMNMYPRELSGGMRMRVSIARALAAKPTLLLMDEPFGALDEMTRQRLNDELLRICALAGWTVLFVTHNVVEAVFLSTRVIVMSSRPGRIIADVPVELQGTRTRDLRTAPEFNAHVGHVSHLLQEAE